MTVFVVHPPNNAMHHRDLTDANRFGDLRFINMRYVFPDELDSDRSIPPVSLTRLAQAAQDFDPVRDFFLIFGDHLQIIQFSAFLSQLYSWFHVLRYDRQERAYVRVKVSTGVLATAA